MELQKSVTGDTNAHLLDLSMFIKFSRTHWGKMVFNVIEETTHSDSFF